MNDFEFYSPTRFVFGRGVTDAVGQHVVKLGYKRALLVYGGGSVVRTGTLARVKESLAKAGIEFVELSGVRPNPEVASVREGIAVARENDVDLVLPLAVAARSTARRLLRSACSMMETCGISSPKKQPLSRHCRLCACLLFPLRVRRVPAHVLFRMIVSMRNSA